MARILRMYVLWMHGGAIKLYNKIINIIIKEKNDKHGFQDVDGYLLWWEKGVCKEWTIQLELHPNHIVRNRFL